MRPHKALLLGLLAALLLVRGARAAAGDAAEEDCVAEGGSQAYANDAADFPYTLDYTVSAVAPESGAKETTFVFTVCSEKCTAGDAFCQPLAALQLRLADSVLAAADFTTAPAAAPVTTCLPRGPGALFEGAALGELATDDPATSEESCASLYVTLPYAGTLDAGVDLQELCEQDLLIEDVATGAVVFDQAKEAGDSCVVVMQLAGGASGVTFIKSGKARPPRPTPGPGPGPTPYPYGRRLQEAGAGAEPALERLF